MSMIKPGSDISGGIKKIHWVQQHMPVLTELEKQYKDIRPFEGFRITMSIHLEAKTANLALVLKNCGADVAVTGCNPLSTQDDIAAALDSLGVPVYGWRGTTAEEYESHLLAALDHRPHLILDDGGDLVALLAEKRPELAENLIGGCEETTTGVRRLISRAASCMLPWPMMNVNDAKSKHYFDNKYGTGQSVMDSLMNNTNLLVAGKTVVIAGYGYCSRGIAMRAKGMGADVIITEIDPFKALEATMENFRVMTMDEAAPLGDVFITATGCKEVITTRHFNQMKNGAILGNAGHFDVEVDCTALRDLAVEIKNLRENIDGYYMADGRVLLLIADGRLLNLAGGNGHPAEIMDMSFALQFLSLKYMAEQGKSLAPAVYNVPDDLDRIVVETKLKSRNITIDVLTPEQAEYLAGWTQD